MEQLPLEPHTFVSLEDQKLASLFIEKFKTIIEKLEKLSAPDADPLLSEEELARRLGLGERTIKNRLNDRVMAYSEIKGKRYVYTSEFNRYIQQHLISAKKAA